MIRSRAGLNLGRRDVMVFIMCLCVCWVGYLMQSPKLLDEVPQMDDEFPEEPFLDEVLQKPVLDEVPQTPVLDEVPEKLVLNEVQIQTTVHNQNHLWITLMKHILSKQSPNSNVVFSPLSIHGIMGLMAAGSEGQTLDQVLSFLKTKTLDELTTRITKLLSLMDDGSSSGGPNLSSANSAWIDQSLSLKTSFKQVLNNVYKATCKQVSFWNKPDEAVIEVNSWAEKQTNGLIKGVLPHDAVSSETRLIIANAVHFKGTWKKSFDQSVTTHFDFHLIDGSKVKVPFMVSLENQLVSEYDGFKVLGLPYSQGEDKRRFTMYMFLPNEKDALPILIEKIGSESDFLERHIPPKEVDLGWFMIPKFKITFGFKASDTLKELGLVLPFTCGGGLTEMTDEGLHVSSIHHKAFLEVNEEGTEAAATTSYSADGPSVDFVADHPFLFMIREDVSGEVLFMGQVVNPSAH